MARLLTVGHGTAAQEDFAALITGAGVAELVDVRIAPGSRRHPHLARTALQEWLPVCYRWDKRLGGYRKLPPDSPDTALRNESFRAYAAHMRTPEFAGAIAELVTDAAQRQVAIMCSETVWWRCHRRLIADHLQLLHDVPVAHLLPGGRQDAHEPTAGVRVAGTQLVYDVAAADPRS